MVLTYLLRGPNDVQEYYCGHYGHHELDHLGRPLLRGHLYWILHKDILMDKLGEMIITRKGMTE